MAGEESGEKNSAGDTNGIPEFDGPEVGTDDTAVKAECGVSAGETSGENK